MWDWVRIVGWSVVSALKSRRKIGIEVSDSTVWRYLPPRGNPPSQSWRSFLQNHLPDIVAIDFFVVPTATFRALYVFLVMSHDRHRVRRVESIGIKEVVTAPGSPWQDPYCERLIGSIRRECLDHIIVLRRTAHPTGSSQLRVLLSLIANPPVVGQRQP